MWREHIELTAEDAKFAKGYSLLCVLRALCGDLSNPSYLIFQLNINMCTHIICYGDKMPTMTLSVPNDLYDIIKSHKEIKWSEIARRAMWEYAMKLNLLDKILEKSEFTEKDAMEMDKIIKRSLREHYESGVS